MIRPAPADTVTLRVPFRLAKRGGRKEMRLPEGIAPPRRPDDALVKALARAFRWKRMIDAGRYTTIADLAAQEGIAPSYLTRILRLTLLAPDIVEAILDGRQAPQVTLARLMDGFPEEWEGQRKSF
ncbi:hypothetical protein [Rubellimicrobium sp. CFH 75288]|uniref:hypothetical protein n=1 Tax=Rubellimicrobium sp. CFH 75288 TaxID=2697034 RepID=UPI00141362B2|nr:hypothetical protein [Rubellimicrobium sp. CFH 75288]NAZ36787.1 hypothetical protein [Rubellimicrobium sp. CFH 75288]